MKKYKIRNISEMEDLISNCKIKVPERSNGRQTLHTELYAFRNFLYQIRHNRVISFPLELCYQDRPDFRINTINLCIGIEVTESIPKQLAKAQYLLEKQFPGGGILEPSFFDWNSPERTDQHIIEILRKSQKQLIGRGYTGNSVEILWVHGILACIKNKTMKLNRLEFEKYDANWLLIYDNQIRSFLDKSLVIDLLSTEMFNYFNQIDSICFENIIIESGSYYYFIEKDKISIEDSQTK